MGARMALDNLLLLASAPISYVVRSVQLDRSIISARRGVWRWPAAIEQEGRCTVALAPPVPGRSFHRVTAGRRRQTEWMAALA